MVMYWKAYQKLQNEIWNPNSVHKILEYMQIKQKGQKTKEVIFDCRNDKKYIKNYMKKFYDIVVQKSSTEYELTPVKFAVDLTDDNRKVFFIKY